MGLMSSIIGMIMKVAMSGEISKVNKTTSKGGEFYDLAIKAKESSKNLADGVNSGLQKLIGAKDEEEIFNKLDNGELSDDRIDALRFAVEVFESGQSNTLSPSAKVWLANASKALTRFDNQKK